tara:strand:- start:328 stop:495 length:168 start_codon:yes stop_codon:yes gene_type:complete
MNHEKLEMRRQLNESMKAFVKGGGVIKKIPTGKSGIFISTPSTGLMGKRKGARDQ